jgi:hypothetical protein
MPAEPGRLHQGPSRERVDEHRRALFHVHMLAQRYAQLRGGDELPNGEFRVNEGVLSPTMEKALRAAVGAK